MDTSTTFVTAHRPLRVSRMSTIATRTASTHLSSRQTRRVSIKPLISPREQEILHLIAYEHSSKEIAEKLFVSHETVNSHRKNMMDKLGVRNAAGLVRVAFERGLMRVGQVACLIIFLFCGNINAQDQADVSNDTEVNWQARTKSFTVGKSDNSDDNQDGTNYPTFLIKSRVDVNNTSEQTLQTGYDQSSGHDHCIAWNADIPSTHGRVIDLQTKTNTTMYKMDFSWLAYDKKIDEDWDSRCKLEKYEYLLKTNYDYIDNFSHTLINGTVGSRSLWREHSRTYTEGKAFKLETTWRYAKGNHSGSSALSFGTINSGTKSHINSNRAAPSGANVNMGYTNLWSSSTYGMQSSPDVVYSFDIAGNAKKVTLSTDYASTTNFDTKIHLIRDNGGTFNYITSNDDINGSSNRRSKIVADLGPGTYAVIVEGFGSNTGDFKVSVSATSASINPGTISQPSNNFLCDGVKFPQINNSQFASAGSSANFNLGSVEYTWQWDRGGSFDDIPGGSNVSTLPSVSSRVMEGETIRFRRKATLSGNVAYSLPIIFNFQQSSTTAGTIAYDPARKYVRNGYILENKIRSVSPGGGSAPISYKWQKKVGLGGSFVDITNGGSLYTGIELPASIAGPITGETRFKRIALNVCNKPAETEDNLVIEAIDSVAIISGKVTAPPLGAGVGIEGVMVTATPLDPLYGVETEVTYTSSESGKEGEFKFNNLYVGKEDIRYEIKPLLEDHRLRVAQDITSDSVRTVLLENNPGSESGVNFVDLTVFTVKGQVYQDYNGKRIGKQGVVMYLDDFPEDTTDINGNYELVINNPGLVKIEPKFIKSDFSQEHDFSPAIENLTILTNRVGVDFEDTSQKSISLFVGAGCNLKTGTVDLRFYNDEDGPFDETITTNAAGNIMVDMPARDYKIEYINNTLTLPNPPPYEYSDVNVQYLSSLKLDVSLAFSDTSLAYFYKAPLNLEISGIPELPSCTSGSYAFPVLEQAKLYPTFDIKVWEGPIGSCALDTGFVDFTDNVADRGLFALPISQGSVDFTLVAGDPNIIDPHTKKLFVTANSFVETHPSVDTSFEFLVIGEKARPSNFVTVSPQIPLLILHDPPGDQSFATFKSTETFETVLRTSSKKAGLDGVWETSKIGAEFSVSTGAVVSFGVNNAVWGSIGGELETTKTDVSLEESLISISSTDAYSTSAEQDIFIMGDPGDVYVGGAINFKYALTDIVGFDYEVCEVDTSVNLAVNPENIATTFIKTGHGIRNTITELKNLMQVHPDSVNYYQNQINVWESTLASNADRKQMVIDAGRTGQFYDANYTIDGGGISKTHETTSTTSSTNSTEFWLEIDRATSYELGIEVAGTGLQGGFYHQFKTETGESADTTETQDFTVSYTIKDDDTNDDISFDVYEDPVYKTPIFDVYSSTTSCPFEGMDPLDKFVVTATSSQSVSNVQPGEAAEFFFTVTNTGTKIRDYTVKSNSSYNQDAAEIRIGAAAPLEDLPLRLDPNDPTQVVVRVRNNSTTVFSYPGLRIEIDPECDGAGDLSEYSLKQYLSLNARFSSPCSSITLAEPLPGDIVNIADNNSLKILMTDYDKTKLNTVSLEYRMMGQNTWKSSSISLSAASLSDLVTGTTRFWDTSELIEDGAYELRLQVQCNSIVNYSDIVHILVDRAKPIVFGLPNPIDDNYSIADGDVISVQYNELICSSLGTTPANAIIIDLVSGDTILTNVTCAGNEVAIVEQGDALSFRPASIYRVILNGIEDRQENPADEYRWVFTVGDFSQEESGFCLPDLLITNNNTNQDAISISNYAAQRISSDGVIPDFGNTSYTAEEQITLEEGFVVLFGGDFLARIEDCDAPAPCDNITSPQGVADAPSERLRWDVTENETCVIAIPYNSSVPQNSAIEVDVNSNVNAGDPSQVNVTLQVTSPNGGGVTDKNIVLTQAGASVDMGLYIAANGSLYNVAINLTYDGVRIVRGTVTMNSITSS